MCRLIFKRGLIAGLCCLAWANQGIAGERPTLVFTQALMPPIVQEDGTGARQLLAKELFSRLGYDVAFQSVPSRMELQEVAGDYVDGLLMRSKAIEKKLTNLIRLDESAYTSNIYAFTKKADIIVNSYNDLRPLRVGFIAGWKRIDDQTKKVHTVVKAKDLPELVGLLQNDAIDVFIYGRLVAQVYLHTHGIGGIRIAGAPLERLDVYVYLTAKHAALAQKAETVLRAMKHDGTWDTIHQRVTASLNAF